jgi:UDP-N-acetylmuramoyl-tripeptide--D-alanyl-D-alanine ligase
MRLSEAARATQAVLTGADGPFEGVSTDTRLLSPGQIFFALKGERADGHDRVAEARAKGAAGAVVERDTGVRLPLLRVADTRRALGLLAKCWRARFQIPIVAVTGSNGKTTVKEMVASILGTEAAVLATEGNFNNDIGVPKTLFGLGPEHRYAVVEMGANHPGEIAWLAEITQPSVAVVTTCAPAHLEGFGSIEGVARAKGELYAALRGDGVAVINAGDRFCTFWQGVTGSDTAIQFGLDDTADVYAADIEFGAVGQGSRFRLISPEADAVIDLPLDGLHNVNNALAAAASAYGLGISIESIRAGLEQVLPVTGRLQLRRGIRGSRIIDDAYNANPASLNAALAVLERSGGHRWLLLGDMGELGPHGRHLHHEAGRAARAARVDRLFAVGDLSRAAVDAFGEGARYYENRDALIEDLRRNVDDTITLLVKGSRSMHLEQIISAISNGANQRC